MAMDAEMLWGMALIVAGIVVAGYGLLPSGRRGARAGRPDVVVSAPEDAPLGAAHWRLMVVLTIALVIDVMKPASLGFVVPGMRDEYGVSAATVAWLPFAALCGTVVGSVLWGWLADLYGRRASILLSAVMFVGTSICGAMPSLWWNVGMCFLMGAAAGGMLPVTYALLAETMPSRSAAGRWSSSAGSARPAATSPRARLSAWLVPIFSWRILWFLNLPTGLAADLPQRLHPRVAQVPARDRPRPRSARRPAPLRLRRPRRRATRSPRRAARRRGARRRAARLRSRRPSRSASPRSPGA